MSRAMETGDQPAAWHGRQQRESNEVDHKEQKSPARKRIVERRPTRWQQRQQMPGLHTGRQGVEVMPELDPTDQGIDKTCEPEVVAAR